MPLYRYGLCLLNSVRPFSDRYCMATNCRQIIGRFIPVCLGKTVFGANRWHQSFLLLRNRVQLSPSRFIVPRSDLVTLICLLRVGLKWKITSKIATSVHSSADHYAVTFTDSCLTPISDTKARGRACFRSSAVWEVMSHCEQWEVPQSSVSLFGSHQW